MVGGSVEELSVGRWSVVGNCWLGSNMVGGSVAGGL